jgi:hypothetical protein
MYYTTAYTSCLTRPGPQAVARYGDMEGRKGGREEEMTAMSTHV